MKESKIISLIARELAGELNSADKAEIGNLSDSFYHSEKDAYANSWNAAESYLGNNDINVDLAFENFTKKFDFSENETIESSQRESSSLFLKLTVAVAILMVGFFVLQFLSSKNSTIQNNSNQIENVVLDGVIAAALSPNASFKHDGSNLTELNGNIQFEASKQSDFKILMSDLEISAGEESKTSNTSNAQSSNTNDETNEANRFPESKGGEITSESNNTDSNTEKDINAGDLLTESKNSSAANLSFSINSTASENRVKLNNGQLSLNLDGKIIDLDKGNTIVIDPVNNSFTVETEGSYQVDYLAKTLSFDRTPLDVVIDEIELYFGVKIELENSIPSNCHFTAQNISDPSINDVFALLHTSFNMGVKRNSLNSYEVYNIECK